MKYLIITFNRDSKEKVWSYMEVGQTTSMISADI